MDRYIKSLLLLITLSVITLACQQTSEPTTTPTSAPRATKTLPLTPEPPPTNTQQPTATNTPLPTSTSTPAPTFTSTAAPTEKLGDIAVGPFRAVARVDDTPFGNLIELRFSPTGDLWLLASESASKLVGDTWETVLTDIGGTMLGMDDAGRTWVLSSDLITISYWDEVSWKDYWIDEGWEPITDYYTPYRQTLNSDTAGNLWYATSQDVRIFDGERWTILLPEEMGFSALPDEDIMNRYYIRMMENAGQVWIGHCIWSGPGPFGGQGVRWFDGSRWHGATSQVSSGCVVDIVEDSSGNIWLGSEEYLWRYTPSSGKWTRFDPPELPPVVSFYGAIIGISTDPSGDLWVTFLACGGASCGEGRIYRFHNGAWISLSEEVLPYSSSGDMIFSPGGETWIFMPYNGVFQVIDDNLEPSALFPSSELHTFDETGKVWFVAAYEGENNLWTLDQE